VRASAVAGWLRHCGIAMKDVLDPEFLPVLLKKRRQRP